MCYPIELVGFSGAEGALDLVGQAADFYSGERSACSASSRRPPASRTWPAVTRSMMCPCGATGIASDKAGVDDPHGLCGAASVEQAALFDLAEGENEVEQHGPAAAVVERLPVAGERPVEQPGVALLTGHPHQQGLRQDDAQHGVDHRGRPVHAARRARPRRDRG